LIKIIINLFDILKMESETTKTTTTTSTFLETVCDNGGKLFVGEQRKERCERQLRTLADVQTEMRVLCWVLSLPSDHPDSSFFREGQCPKCSFCNDEFHFLHYTSGATGYCIKCYLDRFCDVSDDENVFRVVIKRTGRILIKIQNS
jgi:hypothetical protein